MSARFPSPPLAHAS